MKRIAIMGLSILAVLAMSVGTASAAKAKPKLTLKTAAGALTAGDELKASAPGLLFTTEAGKLECTTNILKGSLETNESIKADTGKITTEESSGGEAGGACKTSTPLGPAKITGLKLPWAQTFTVKKTAETKNVSFLSEFDKGAIDCTFEDKKVVSKFNTGGPLELVVSGQKFKLGKGSNANCPKSGTLEGTFSVTSKGEVVEAVLA